MYGGWKKKKKERKFWFISSSAHLSKARISTTSFCHYKLTYDLNTWIFNYDIRNLYDGFFSFFISVFGDLFILFSREKIASEPFFLFLIFFNHKFQIFNLNSLIIDQSFKAQSPIIRTIWRIFRSYNFFFLVRILVLWWRRFAYRYRYYY